MKVLLQRVSSASVRVNNEITGSIDSGLLLFVGFGQGDNEAILPLMTEKLVHMRIFPDDKGRFHHSLKDIGGGVLLISQFTLFADARKGRRPEFFGALEPKRAAELFSGLPHYFFELGIPRVESGVFGADMKVSLVNDGPVTILLDSSELFPKRSAGGTD